jgi:hypothetical protein
MVLSVISYLCSLLFKLWVLSWRKQFLYFSWAVIRRVSAHAVFASRWTAASYGLEVGRYSIDFGPGVGRYSRGMGQKSVVLCPLIIICGQLSGQLRAVRMRN